MRHHTKDKGDLGVLKIQADLCQQGFMLAIPLTEHAPFDIIAYKNGKFYRVQAKYRTLDNKGVVSVSLQNTWSDKYGVHKKAIPKDEIDVMAIYCPEVEQCFYFDPKKANRNKSLRITPSKNNQQEGVVLASECRLMDNVIKE